MISFRLFLFTAVLSLNGLNADEGKECNLADVEGTCKLRENCPVFKVNNTLLNLELLENVCSSDGSVVCCPQNVSDFSVSFLNTLLMNNESMTNTELESLVHMFLSNLPTNTENVPYMGNSINTTDLFSLPYIGRFNARNNIENISSSKDDVNKKVNENPITTTEEIWENDDYKGFVAGHMCYNYMKRFCAEKPEPGAAVKTDDTKSIFYIDPIFGGTPAAPKEFKAAAVIGCKSKSGEIEWQCGGTLISENYIVTAAHCLNTDCGPVTWARLGDLNLMKGDEDSKPRNYRIIERIRHPLYNDSSLYHDIGLLKLEETVEFNDYVGPACLPTMFHGFAFDPNYVTAIGWGSTEYGSAVGSSVLLKVNLTTINEEDCNRHYIDEMEMLNVGIDKKWQICAGSPGKDTCQGDSGGPLVAVHLQRQCMKDVLGVTSFGKPCGEDVPGIYTRVYSYINWIENVAWPETVAYVRKCFDDKANNRPTDRVFCDVF